MTSSQALDLAGELIARYKIAALEDFIESCRAFAREKTLNVAVFGRFKAGKSSFLNHLLGKPVLPVGVIPVTSVITRIEFGPREAAEVRFLDGRIEPISPAQVGDFVSEASNPENVKQVAVVHIELPEMERYRGISFVDTPGLESVFAHNSDASMEWLPNAGLALVAVGVDPPLSRHDIDLIRSLSYYTPNISLLLTKVDLLEEDERSQVEAFVHEQLERHWNGSVAVLPYSVRPGFEHLRTKLEERLLSPVRAESDEQRAAILLHKANAVLGECADYLNVALKAAQSADSEREQLQQRIFGEKEFSGDAQMTVQLIARHAAGTTRAKFEEILRKDEQAVRQRVLADLDQAFPAWTRSLKTAIDEFEDWLRNSVTREMAACSRQHRGEFLEPARSVSRQLSQSLQDFRNRLSERTLAVLGVPLRTTQMELQATDPRSPDIRVSKIFDHNWELVSFAAPMALWKGVVKRHFERTVADVVFMNLSRLASQWEEIVNAALLSLEKDAAVRLDSLIASIETLLVSAGQEAPRIKADLDRISLLTDRVSANNTASPPASAPSAPRACHSDRIN
jgi:GTP-binding protein EngB required for normal cell division